VLAAHPDVAEAYVVGAPYEETRGSGPRLRRTRDGLSPDCEALRVTVAGQLGDACVPRTIIISDSASVAASGRPDKGALAAGIRRSSEG